MFLYVSVKRSLGALICDHTLKARGSTEKNREGKWAGQVGKKEKGRGTYVIPDPKKNGGGRIGEKRKRRKSKLNVRGREGGGGDQLVTWVRGICFSAAAEGQVKYLEDDSKDWSGLSLRR